MLAGSFSIFRHQNAQYIYTHMWLAESASVHQGKYGGRMSTVDVLLEV